MTTFRPGTSPPPVRMPMRGFDSFVPSVDVQARPMAAAMDPSDCRPILGDPRMSAAVRRTQNDCAVVTRAGRWPPGGHRAAAVRLRLEPVPQEEVVTGTANGHERRPAAPSLAEARPSTSARRRTFASRPITCGARVRNSSSTRRAASSSPKRCGPPRTGPAARRSAGLAPGSHRPGPDRRSRSPPPSCSPAAAATSDAPLRWG